MRRAGYVITLHVIVVPVDLADARVVERTSSGGHRVPEEKVRARSGRLWGLVAAAVEVVDEAVVHGNSRAARPFRTVARYRAGHLLGTPGWPAWVPDELRAACS
jgi:predicted ABC-type ATPase